MNMTKINHITPHEFFLGQLLNDENLWNVSKNTLPASANGQISKMFEIMKASSSGNFFVDFYKHSKELCVYAMEISNYVAQHTINQKGKHGKHGSHN